MIIDMFFQKDSPNGMKINYDFIERKNNKFVANAFDNINEFTTIKIGNKSYEFPNYPKIVSKASFNFVYPLSSNRKKTVGFNIVALGEPIGFFYQEAARCKKGLFKSKIGFTVFSFNNSAFLLFRVGFKEENSHYYCLYDDNNNLIAIIERKNYYEGSNKASVYIKDENYLTIALLACTEELVSVPNSGGSEYSMDTSAGKYISILDEEKALFNREFIEEILNDEISNG